MVSCQPGGDCNAGIGGGNFCKVFWALFQSTWRFVFWHFFGAKIRTARVFLMTVIPQKPETWDPSSWFVGRGLASMYPKLKVEPFSSLTALVLKSPPTSVFQIWSVFWRGKWVLVACLRRFARNFCWSKAPYRLENASPLEVPANWFFKTTS